MSLFSASFAVPASLSALGACLTACSGAFLRRERTLFVVCVLRKTLEPSPAALALPLQRSLEVSAPKRGMQESLHPPPCVL
ncbi:hypothetical protein NDU88_004701 [Pleurodeles waltl]|uniref:Secreted protein n=1 Tax=Pleurodeles waltl TaxID=8319 RepID=A0AAV7TS92_PLEWA|nr:hypothetical protein NDU88_004701 [Pleurodeles waltl]